MALTTHLLWLERLPPPAPPPLFFKGEEEGLRLYVM
jgi:hypothetical protein